MISSLAPDSPAMAEPLDACGLALTLTSAREESAW